ncbi:MAG: hypothetical protein KA137_11825 [Halioglobus sp.]|nr:hypothetical protein [Halioglobus sp.]
MMPAGGTRIEEVNEAIVCNFRFSAKGVIDDMEHERQQHFVLQPFVHFWRKSWADESERPHIENRYSPF